MAWVSPTGHNDPDSAWDNETNAYDEDTGTAAKTNVDPQSWSSYLELTHVAIDCDKVRFDAYYSSGFINQISLDVYYEGAWHNIYEGSFAYHTWVEKTIPAGTKSVTAARAKFYNTYTLGVRPASFYEFDFGQVGVTHELAGVISGLASVSGAVLMTRGLAGLASGVCSVSGLAIVTYVLAGISQGVASVSGLAGIMRWLAGASSGVASVTGSLLKIKYLSGLTAGVCSVVGSLPVTRGLAGVVSGVCSVTGSLLRVKWLSGLVAGVATVTGKLFHVRTAIRVLAAVRNLPAVRNIPPVR